MNELVKGESREKLFPSERRKVPKILSNGRCCRCSKFHTY